MVSRDALRRASDQLGHMLPLAYLVVMAVTTIMLYRVYERTWMILHVLNGGCLP